MNIIVNQIHEIDGSLSRILHQRLAAAARLLQKEHCFARGEVAVILADDRYLRKLNHRFCGQDLPTDVLSFSMEESSARGKAAAGETGAPVLGDIYISLDRARDQADAAGHSLEQEILILALHGLLHLCGYDHSEAASAEAMEQKESDLLEQVKAIPVGEGAVERLVRSFRDAFAGLGYCFTTQRNMVIHLAAGAMVIALAFLFRLEAWKHFLILTAVFAVLFAETINTAIEKTVDLITREQHVLARIAKDVSAGAVLLAAFYAVLIGLYIFGPYIQEALLNLIQF